MIETRLAIQAQDADRLEQPQCPGIGIGPVFWRFERNGNLTLCGEVVDLVRLDLLDDDAYQIGRIGEVAVVHDETATRQMRLDQMINAIGVEQGSAPRDTVNFVALV
jgi:hypothetical protein